MEDVEKEGAILRNPRNWYEFGFMNPMIAKLRQDKKQNEEAVFLTKELKRSPYVA